jgi:hypothetical protein
MMCCGICCKWQHIACHDGADIQAGRTKKNWDDVEFFCQRCRSRTASNYIADSDRYNHPAPSILYLPLRPPACLPAEVPANQHPHSTANYPAQRLSESYMDARILSMPTNGVTHIQGQPSHIHAHSESPSYSQPHPHRTQPQQQHYPSPHTTIAFTHYQPQRRGFSSNARNTSRTQPYDQPSSGQFVFADAGANSQMSNSSYQVSRFKANGIAL